MTPALECRHVSVSYADVRAVRSIDLDVGTGEALALLGPSGSGKSTLLYAIAGFLDLDGGSVSVSSRVVSTSSSTVPPEQRPIGFVFQNYALWPHLTAEDTVAYPMRRAGMSKREARNAAMELLELVGIGELAHRKPAELSGGQQQRVGLARALAREADLYLFDEPTAHLDAALRTSVQEEISRRRRDRGAAAVYATHDSAEALAIADRVAVLRYGSIVQVGAPDDIYERPVDAWVAGLTGPVTTLVADASPAATGAGGRARVRIGDTSVPVEIAGPLPAGPVSVLVRPEWIRLGSRVPDARGEGDPVEGKIRERWYRGAHTDYRLDTPLGALDARADGPPALEIGDIVHCVIQRGWVPHGRRRPPFDK